MSGPEQSGVATHFEAFGQPYGGCGVPQDAIDTPHYAALNAFATPGFYGPVPVRPHQGDPSTVGLYADGGNCGRFLEVTLGANCVDGNASGEPGVAPCEGGSWVDDEFSGARLVFQVSDECTDGNSWCRDVPGHLDLATASLNLFEKDGEMSASLYPEQWNNRKVSWHFVHAPGYSGDVSVSFVHQASRYWPAVLINHLPNGIHGVEQLVGGSWQPAERVGFMGQQFVLPDGSAEELTIRIRDASEQLLFGGRTYTFSFPCAEVCEQILNPVSYRTEG